MKRNVYLKNTDIEEALAAYMDRLKPVFAESKVETVDIRNADGRITAEPIIARLSSPNHNAAAMDGIMVIAGRTFEATEANPVVLRRGEDFEYVNTGNPIREPYDAVIMIEDVVLLDESAESGELQDEALQVKIMTQASPWQHIRPIGEDIVAGEMILPASHKIRPVDIGAVLSGGITDVCVYEKISVGIMPTGNEICDSYDNLEAGHIFDTNSWTFKAVSEKMGCTVERLSPVPDDRERLKGALKDLLKKNDMVIINAGSSAGSKDYTAELIGEMGELVLHGIAIKPGKPTILGIVDSKPVIGLPGYPGSAYLVFEEIVGPVIKAMQHDSPEACRYAEAVISRRIVSSLKYREYIRVKLGIVGERMVATPLNRGAGVTMALVKADGLLIVPKNSEGFEAGETAQVEMLRNMKTIENTIVSIGSHDLIMDYIASILEKKTEGEKQIHLSSAHVGSMGGIMALKRGEAHIAPIHLLDEESGVYNDSYIKKYLNDKAVLVKGVKRIQGFMVKPGNPKNINSIVDLAKDGVSFANRQRGAGTRILTDYLMKEEGISSKSVMGYSREMTTHMAVAAAVQSGSADVGIGVASAAKAMGLEFIEIGREEYDFAIAESYVESPMIAAFLGVLKSDEFKQLLLSLEGYELWD